MDAVFSVKCWGKNDHGQLGYGDTETRGDTSANMGSSLNAIDLGTGRSARAIAIGSDHSCVLLDNAMMKCWGDNTYGQLGQGHAEHIGDDANEMGDNLLPINLGTGRTVIAITAGWGHTCAVLDDETVKCWGFNDHGQLGLGNMLGKGAGSDDMGDALPTVDLGADFKAMTVSAATSHTCALSTTGAVKCWGLNNFGQLGIGAVDNRGDTEGEMGDNLPYANLGVSYIAVAIATGSQHTCAILDNNYLKCWGWGGNGQLGYGDNANRGGFASDMGENLLRVDLGESRTVAAVSAGGGFTCALLDDAGVKCWGENGHGQLGQGHNAWSIGDEPDEMGDDLAPVQLGAGETALAVGNGLVHTMALLSDGTLKCWGSNDFAQLGIGSIGSVIGDVASEMGDSLQPTLLADTAFRLCPQGQFGRQSTSCQQCAAGYWGLARAASVADCIPCRGGYSESPGSTSCIGCPAGTSSSVQGATSESESECTDCVAGKYAEQTTSAACTDCRAGTYSTVNGSSTSTVCSNCPSGSSSVAGAGSLDDCQVCSKGKYADLPGSPACTSCPAGKYSADVGAISNTTCIACDAGKFSGAEAAPSELSCNSCPAGKYSDEQGAIADTTCISCNAGTYSSAPAAPSQESCIECEPGTFSGEGEPHCAPCDDGWYASEYSSASCAICPRGTYSVSTECVDCPVGRSSIAGSTEEGDCESLTTSVVVGGILLVVAVVVVMVYILAGRAAKVAAAERQSVLVPIIHACGSISAELLATMKRRQETGTCWRPILVVVLTIALFVTSMFTFLTNIFLLSRSFLAAPQWVETFEEQVLAMIERIPVLGFLYIVLPILKFIESIDFADLLNGMEVSCSGGQAPMVLLMNALILVGTIIMIGSQLHTVLALALGPAIDLTRDKLVSMPDISLITRASNLLRFVILLIVSSFFNSFSRYTMQVFATLINYADFWPHHAWTPTCNSDGSDEILATVSTIVFYVAVIPVLLLVIPVMMPGRPKARLPEPPVHKELQNTDPQDSADRRPSCFQRALDCLNPFKWLFVGVHWLLNSLYGHAAMQQPPKQRTVSPSESYNGDANSSENVGCVELMKSCICCGPTNLCQVIAVYAWRLKLSVLLSLGIWTDEIVQNLQVDEIAQQHFSWTAEHTRLHEDVMSAVGPMRSMVWMLVPVTIVFTKLSEVTNNPPVLVRSGLVKMMSPVLFGSWSAAEAVMLEGKALFDKLGEGKEATSALEHNLRVALVWVFGARLPRYIMNVIIVLLAAAIALRPTVSLLLLAAIILLPWAFLSALAIVLDVTTMLNLRKLSARTKDVQTLELSTTVKYADGSYDNQFVVA